MGHRSKVRGRRLDQLYHANVFYVEQGQSGFLIAEGSNAAYFATLSPELSPNLGDGRAGQAAAVVG